MIEFDHEKHRPCAAKIMLSYDKTGLLAGSRGGKARTSGVLG